MSVSRDDVRAAYRFILGRPPESDAVIVHHQKNNSSLDTLRVALFASEEFQSQRTVSLTVPPQAIETVADPVTLRAIVAKTGAYWEAAGETAPHHSVLTYERYEPDQFAENEKSFFESGRNDLDLLLALLRRIGRPPEQFRRCLEFGCGVGRVTAQLAATFPEVIALDISRPHLRLAQAYVSRLGHANVSFLQVTAEDLHPGAGYDLWFSRLVLQHNPPPVNLHILDQMFAGLAPGGVAIVQIPTYHVGYSFSIADYLVDNERAEMEMHATPQRAIFELAWRHNSRLLDIREEPVGPVFQDGWVTNLLVFEKANGPYAAACTPTGESAKNVRHPTSSSEIAPINHQAISGAEDTLTAVEIRAVYEILLGRRPESEEFAQSQSGFGNSAVTLARSLCESEEFHLRLRHQATGPITRGDVQTLYGILLGRPPESDEVIDVQRSRHNSAISLARSIYNSAEAQPRAEGGVKPSLTGEDVRALHKTFFGREPDGNEDVEAEVRLHKSAISLARSLCHPDKVRLYINNEADDAHVKAVYRIVLDCQPESDDVAKVHLTPHKSLAALASSLCDTAEFRARIRREIDRPVTRADVRELYEIFLERQPESNDVIEMQSSRHQSVISLARALSQSEEYRMRIRSGAETFFDGYRYGELNILRRHLSSGTPEAGFLKDFVGTRMRVEFNTSMSALSGLAFDRIPVPGDFRVEAIEWIGVLKAIEDSGSHFVTIELGAGWGPWVVASGHVARRLGKTVRMYAVEADPGKVPNIARHMTDNGFDPKDHVIFGGIAGPSDGFAYFPVIDAAGNWSGEAVYDQPPKGDYHKLPSISLRALMKEEQVVDLIHFDIQGAEFDVVAGSVDELSAKVKWMVIGTHARSIEGRLIDLLLQRKWSLENEQPSRCSYTAGRSQIFIDGTQVWRNLNL